MADPRYAGRWKASASVAGDCRSRSSTLRDPMQSASRASRLLAGRFRASRRDASEPQRPATKVVYVMGAGHSGSTILGVALGNFPDFFYAGEVEEWLAASARPARGGVQRNEFWAAVREEMQRSPADDLFGTEVNRLVERSSALLRIDRWAAR